MLIFILNVHSYINAQNDYKDSVILLSGKEKYTCKPYGNNNRIIVRNVRNILFNEKMLIPKGVQQLNIDSDPAREKIKFILSEVLPQTNKVNSSVHSYVLIIFWIKDTGQILELDFRIAKDSPIKPSNLAEIEQRIKNEVVFSFTDDTWKGTNFIRFGLTFPL